MKWLLSPFLWIGAAVVAGWVVYRIWRGKPMILRGRLGPRTLRLVAILLVLLGLGVDDRPAQAAQPGSAVPPAGLPGGGRGGEATAPLPENLTIDQIDRWLAYQRDLQGEMLVGYHQTWRGFKSIMARLEVTPTGPQAAQLRALVRDALKMYPPPFARLIEADLKAGEEGKPAARATAREILAAVQEMDRRSYFDPWLIAYFWRQLSLADAGREPQAIEVMTCLSRQVRVVHALYRARAQVQPLDAGARAWMSKAGPGPNVSGNGFDRRGLAELARVYADEAGKANLGTWQQDGVALLRVAERSAAPVQIRAGQKVEVKPGETIRLGRLDVLQIPAGADGLVEHGVFGKVRLPAGQSLLIWDLARLLDDDGRRRVSQVVRAALDGKEDAALQVEQALPLCQLYLREELKLQPGAPGAARMRLVLALFDDAVIVPPPLKPNPVPALPGAGVGVPPGAR